MCARRSSKSGHLEAAGCEIVRCAVPVREAAEQLGEIKKQEFAFRWSPTFISITSWR